MIAFCSYYKVLLILGCVVGSFKVTSATCRHEVYENIVPSDADGQRIVDKHNELRLRIAHGEVANQPRGTNLKRLKWDHKLAEAAEKITNTCDFAHVPVKDPRWSWVGQNLYMSSSTGFKPGANWEAAVDSWFSEHEKYHYPDGSGAGHYTQVVWADTEYVGCGYTYFKDDKGWYSKMIACNYGPGGNYNGQPPYDTKGNECPDLC